MSEILPLVGCGFSWRATPSLMGVNNKSSQRCGGGTLRPESGSQQRKPPFLLPKTYINISDIYHIKAIWKRTAYTLVLILLHRWFKDMMTVHSWHYVIYLAVFPVTYKNEYTVNCDITGYNKGITERNENGFRNKNKMKAVYNFLSQSWI